MIGAPSPFDELAEQGPPPGFLEGLSGGAGAAPPPEEEPPLPEDDGEGGPVGLVRDMIALAQNYLDDQDDEEDNLEMAQVIARLQKLLAKEQKDANAAMGNNSGVRFLSRQTAARGY